MNTGNIINYYEHMPRGGMAPKQIVFLLHGLGSNGQDLISLAPYWAQGLPDALFVSPDAPFPCDMAPMGYQWFSLQSRDPMDMLEGVKTAGPILEAFMTEQLKKHNLPASKAALVGFSQGTMMSLFTAPRYADKLAGVLGYSGALIGAEDFSGPNEGFHRLPVHLIHGEADEVVPVEAYHMAHGALERAGFPVNGHTTPDLGHSIDEKGIMSGQRFLLSVL